MELATKFEVFIVYLCAFICAEVGFVSNCFLLEGGGESLILKYFPQSITIFNVVFKMLNISEVDLN